MRSLASIRPCLMPLFGIFHPLHFLPSCVSLFLLLSVGDVIVYINDVCVLGTTHADVVKLFQSVPIGQSVTLVLCRGYPLPYDPEDATNTNNNTTTIISPLGIMEQRPIMVNGRTGYDNYLDYLTRTARFVSDSSQDQVNAQQQLLTAHPGDTHLDGSLPATTGTTPPDSVSMASSGATQGELLTLTMVKGVEGFGFTIADSVTGQRVKQVLEPQGCPGLCEGDLIVEINKQPVQGFTHTQVVELLKECAVGAETSLVVQRGGTGKTRGCRYGCCLAQRQRSNPSTLFVFLSLSAYYSLSFSARGAKWVCLCGSVQCLQKAITQSYIEQQWLTDARLLSSALSSPIAFMFLSPVSLHFTWVEATLLTESYLLSVWFKRVLLSHFLMIFVCHVSFIRMMNFTSFCKRRLHPHPK